MTTDQSAIETKFSILVGIIPVYEGKVLITQRSNSLRFLPGVWGIPAGKLEFSEDLEDAVHRELLEETGLTGDIIEYLGTSKFMGYEKNLRIHNMQFNFVLALHSSFVILDNSSQAFNWITTDQIQTAKMDTYNKEIILRALNFLSCR